jgi:AcrR family transcriptional regulator
MAALDVDSIVAVALRLSDERGAGAVTMRAVANELGVSPMALYHHVDGKAGLVGLLVDAVINERPLPESTGEWQEDLVQMAWWMRQLSHAHPAVAELHRQRQVWPSSILPVTERWMSLWQQSGLPLSDALYAATTTSVAIIGLVDAQLLFQNFIGPDESQLRRAPKRSPRLQRQSRSRGRLSVAHPIAHRRITRAPHQRRTDRDHHEDQTARIAESRDHAALDDEREDEPEGDRQPVGPRLVDVVERG